MVVALTFIFSGFVKAVDPVGTQYKLAEYLSAMHLGSLAADFITLSAAIIISALEFVLGICLLFGIRRHLTSKTVLTLMAFMTVLTLWIALFDPVSDCGCFGDAIVLSNGMTLLKNAVLLACAGIIAWQPRLMIRLIGKASHWLVFNYSVVFIVILSGWSLYDLPRFDFRPYHVGVNLREGWQQMARGEESPYADFFIERIEDGEDITDSLLSADGYLFLLISPHLEQADDSQLDLMNQLYDYAQEEHYPFYCLTASNQHAISHWRDMTGAEYECCHTDETTLKTMIRSNPGVMLLHNGEIIRKWSHNSLPDEYVLSDRLENISLGKPSPDSVPRKILMLMMWYVLPLLLLTIADRLWAWSRWLKKKERQNKIYQLLKQRKKMRKKIVAGNWKMNLNLQEGVALAKELKEALNADKPNCDVVICTPFIHLASVAQAIEGSVIALGAENCADKEKGAFTGEVSAEMVKSTGATHVILGHSERREYYKETPEILKEKVLLALKNGLKVIFCIGETLQEREAEQQNAVVKAELEGSVFNLSAEEFSNIVIAYEPIWAIGTGKTATAEQAEEIHAYIRSIIAEKYGQAVADATSILYGGSCKASNAPELFAKPDIDGGLIGGASLKCADFKGIIDAWK